MVRLKDIAVIARVSVMTVSKALRDEPDVSDATRSKIKALAAQMGYVPDSSAQGLRTKTTKLFGLVVPATTNPVYARMVLAIEERAYDLGYDLLIAHTLNKPEREDLVLRRLLSRRVDGLFITPVYRFEAEARIYQEIAARKIPTVLLGPPAPFCKNFPGVEIEEQIASYNITKHLLGLGHKKIAYFTGPTAAPWAHERFEGYRRALREAGLQPDDKFVFQSGNTIEDGVNAALQMLNENCHPTAIQAVSDLVAIGAAETLLQQGIRIPEDVSIAGFGNILLAEHFRVPLTTVRQPKLRLGHAAVEMMMSLIKGESIQTRRLPAELVERKSTAAPKG
ncbi:MAG TPA: LacI family DNA-binding transcriptional regulator [Candidatus Acidoferrales bacterium]|jgi:LacI family repressor for deo operon, udp, cdd, tsx, nupC, and nupG|nr:LacI family DNA-binding transcriptional regulator [Candidatus Acidoferrales bacterium]